ncbi:site-specific integrase [Flavobacterium sp. CBA20B-1]|uniref:tyrosine-type recombinase/integrase n=1 Tax=unclassified Flavobacterium TaxID=196869 RepID=UPI002224A091|nr:MULTISPECIES: site-specific integrase [unclassified Flavobacterium]WCM42390.1 site-specific integrase [Flavobacterium sp. CBA20B-1]
MISAEIIIDDRRKTKKGFPVKIRIYDSLEKENSPHRYIPLKVYQNSKILKLDSFLKRRYLDLEKEIDYCNKNNLRLNQAFDIILNGIPLDDIESEIKLLEFKLEQLYKKSSIKNKKGFLQFTQELIKERKLLNKDVKAHTTILNILKILIEPEEDFAINDLTKEFLIDLEIKMSERGNKPKTIKTYFTYLSSIYKEAQSRESLNIKKTNPFYKIFIPERRKIEYEISIEDLSKLVNSDFKEVSLKNITRVSTVETIKRDIDIFLFQFAIGGHDFIDVANLKWNNIKKNRLVFHRTKNRNKVSPVEVSVMLSDFANDVIEKYGDKSSERIFSHIPDPNDDYEIYHNFLARLNKSRFKKATQYLGIDTDIKTKAPRYLFRTIAGNLLINDLIIMKIQGHKPQGMTFGYQGAINHQVQDREHKKVLDLVFNSIK